MYELIYTGQFKKELNLMKKRGCDMSLFKEVSEMLQSGMPLGEKYYVHKLHGEYEGCWECNIKNEWLLTYKKRKAHIELQRTGTYNDLH